MKSRRPTPDGQGAAAPAHLRVEHCADGRWTWCWVETATGAELYSNTTYAAQEAANAAARRAYPELPLEPQEPEDAPTDTLGL